MLPKKKKKRAYAKGQRLKGYTNPGLNSSSIARRVLVLGHGNLTPLGIHLFICLKEDQVSLFGGD